MELEERMEFTFDYQAIRTMIRPSSDVTYIKDWDGERVTINRVEASTVELINAERNKTWWVDSDYVEKMLHAYIDSNSLIWR